MAHFAQLENGVVAQVIVLNNEVIGNLPFPESESVGIEFCKSLYGNDTEWMQTSYNSSFRKNYAGIGYTYNAEIDAFVEPQPFASWVLNTETAKWEPPIPIPNDGMSYYWNEQELVWAKIELGE